MKRITVFCGSSAGNDPIYMKEAEYTGKTLAHNNLELVYGGAQVGLMGAVANGTLKAGGKVIGVLPDFLSTKEIAHTALTELIIVKSMHERKLKMHELSDGFIALPGGFGTMEELFEILTWAQLGLHQKPVGLLNTTKFYTPLIDMIEQMVAQGFLKPVNRDMLLVSESVDELLEKMHLYKAPEVGKWIKKDNT